MAKRVKLFGALQGAGGDNVLYTSDAPLVDLVYSWSMVDTASGGAEIYGYVKYNSLGGISVRVFGSQASVADWVLVAPVVVLMAGDELHVVGDGNTDTVAEGVQYS